jgi:hypothetical protein
MWWQPSRGAAKTAAGLRKSLSRSLRGHYVISVMGLLSAASGCAYDKTPHPASWLVAGSSGTSGEVPPAGFEPAHTAPEAVALSPELRGRCRCCLRRRVEPYQLARGGHERFSGAGGGGGRRGPERGIPHWGAWWWGLEERSPARGGSGQNPDAALGARLPFEMCLACPAGSLSSTTTRSSGS